ncbi:MAG: histidine kinase [Clostridia bacterium]|nr:histidine kinase [Clostridia bacterium]MBP3360224.1 histidine kinase [Clostridia bacterium]
MNKSIRQSFYAIISVVAACFLLLFSYVAIAYLIPALSESREFYSYTLNSVEKNINKSMQRIVNVSENVIYNENLQELLDGDDSSRGKNISDMTNLLKAYREVDEDIKYVAVLDISGSYYDFLSDWQNTDITARARRIIYGYDGTDVNGELKFFTERDGIEEKGFFAYVLPIYKIDRQNFYYKKRIGSAIFVYSQELLIRDIREASYDVVDKIVIADENGTVQLSQTAELVGTKVSEDMYADSIELKYGRLHLYSKPFDKYSGAVERMLFFMLVMVLVLLILSLLIINYWFKRYILSDVTQILSVLKDNQNGSAKKRISLPRKNEFQTIAININSMLDGIEEYTKKAFYGQQQLYELEIQLNKMRIYMLKDQVNPHFLYNTLGCIRSLAAEKGLDEVVDISEATISLLRYNLKEKERVTLKQELNECKKYIRIINVRYENIVELSFDTKEEALGVEIIKMIVQPVIENSVYHGLVSSATVLHIHIKAYVDNGLLKLSIADDGNGMSSETLSELKTRLMNDEDSTEHVGLYNVHKRIEMEYGKGFGIDVESEKGKGCTVYITIPQKR